MTEGVTKLPRFPMELISPMEAAAADSPRKAEGTGQNEGRKALALEATVRQTNANQKWEPERIVSAKATTPSISGTAVCQRRSLVRSECQPLISMATSTATYGRIESMVTARSDMPDARLRNVGSQIVRE